MADDLTREDLEAAIISLKAENIRLRAALAQSDLPCVYCTLSVEDWAKCHHGFPGCDRADDAMGCPELGAAMERDRLRDEVQRLKAVISGAQQ